MIGWDFIPLMTTYASKILDAEYEKSKCGGLCCGAIALTPTQKNKLAKPFKNHEELFSGKLGLYANKNLTLITARVSSSTCQTLFCAKSTSRNIQRGT